MTETQPEPHSQLYFTDARDHLWNRDFIALLARRTGLDVARRVLEVGSGQGHFARVWAPHLPAGFELSGVEPEAKSRAVAEERCAAQLAAEKLTGTFRFVDGRAEALPFPDATFDAVICQTLLIHLPDPARGVAEMIRVVRPGGLVLAAEPNNLAAAQRFAALGPMADPAMLAREVEFHARCAKGKAALGLGWNHLGIRLPELLSALEDLRYWQDDRPWCLAPPYASALERAMIADLRDHAAHGIFWWPRDEARRYWEAGGGAPDRFDAEYEVGLQRQREELALIDAGKWTELNAVALLVAAGRRRAQ